MDLDLLYKYTYLCIEFVITHNFQTMIPKHVLCLLIICISCTLATCSSSPDEGVKAKLTQAENIMYSAPDSALQLLEHLQPPKEKEQRATWALLLAQARYKNNVKQSDSLVNAAYDYFEKTDNAERKALALYLKGGMKHEDRQDEEAQTYYLKANDEVEKTNDDRLGFLIHSHLGNLYVYKGIKTYAFKAYEKAYQYAQQFGDAEYIISSLWYLGRVNSMQPAAYKKSISYYKQALNLAEVNHHWKKYDSIIWELVGIYELTGDFPSALHYAQMGLRHSNKDNNLPARLSMILGHIYQGLGKTDSAYYYLYDAIASANNLVVKRGAYNYLYNLERKEGRYKKALEACEQCLIYNDSVYRAEKASEIIEMQAKYDQQKVIAERNHLQTEKERLKLNTLVVIVILIILIALLIITYQRVLIRKEKLLKRQEESVRQNALKLAENERTISRNMQRISELTQQMKEGKDYEDQLKELATTLTQIKEQNQILTDENTHLRDEILPQSIHQQSEKLNEINRLTTENRFLHEREIALTDLLVARNAFLNDLKTKHHYLKDELWPLLQEELDCIFNGYTHRLLKRVPSLSESELRLACLIKLKMSNSNMAETLGISPSSVAKAKMRLKDRLAHSIESFDKSMTLDIWLWEF